MWIITKDFLEPRGRMYASSEYDMSKRPALTKRFRLLDGDGQVYYEGYSDDSDSEGAFGPLDDFGRDNAGCVCIEYLEESAWVPL
jgi:hypothetical protein